MDKYKMFHHMLEIENGSGEKYCKDLRELVAFVYSTDSKAPLNYTLCKSFCEANDLDYGDFLNFMMYSPQVKPMRHEVAFLIPKLESDAARAYKKTQQGW